MRAQKIKGFTLIEIMIAVAIIGILAAIAYPSYQNYIKNGKRADAMTELQNIANRIESQKLATGSYKNVKLETIFADGFIASSKKDKFPATGTQLYTISVWKVGGSRINSNTLPDGKWELRAWPKSNALMGGDGTLKLNYKGIKCRANSCGMDDEWR